MTFLKIKKEYDFLTFSGKELSELLRRAKDGHQPSLSELSQIILKISQSYFLSKVKMGKIPDREDALDLSQDVYLSFSQQYNKIDNIEKWLRRVLFFTFIRWYNKQKRTIFYDDENSFNRHAVHIDYDDQLDSQKILTFISSLSSVKQKIIKLRFWDGMRFSSISKEIGKSEDACKKIFYRTIEEIQRSVLSLIAIIVYYLIK